MTIENVKITNTSITMEDHGVLTFYITVEGAGIAVNLGGYCIGTGYLGAKEFSAENGGGLVAMMNIMNVVGVHKWEDLKGKYCRIKTDGWGSTVSIIGNIIENKWFDMKKFFEEYGDKQAENEKREGQIGEWLINPDGYYPYCSVCHNVQVNGKMTNYCPACGAYMKGESNDKTTSN